MGALGSQAGSRVAIIQSTTNFSDASAQLLRWNSRKPTESWHLSIILTSKVCNCIYVPWPTNISHQNLYFRTAGTLARIFLTNHLSFAPQPSATLRSEVLSGLWHMSNFIIIILSFLSCVRWFRLAYKVWELDCHSHKLCMCARPKMALKQVLSKVDVSSVALCE